MRFLSCRAVHFDRSQSGSGGRYPPLFTHSIPRRANTLDNLRARVHLAIARSSGQLRKRMSIPAAKGSYRLAHAGRSWFTASPSSDCSNAQVPGPTAPPDAVTVRSPSAIARPARRSIATRGPVVGLPTIFRQSEARFRREELPGYRLGLAEQFRARQSDLSLSSGRE